VSLADVQFVPERLASNCQSAAAAIVVCIAARVLNKMSMMTTAVLGIMRVGLSGEGSLEGYGVFIY